MSQRPSTDLRGEKLIPSVRDFCVRGWPVVVGIVGDGKGPPYPSWQNGLPATEAERLLRRNARAMLGVVLGPGVGFWDFEIDDVAGLPIAAEALGDDPPVTPIFQRRGGFPHRIFAWDARFDAIPKAVVKVFDQSENLLAEFRLGHRGAVQSIFPPSGGRRWLVHPDDCPFARPPDCLIRFIERTANDVELLPAHTSEQNTERQRSTERAERTERTEIASLSQSSLPSLSQNDRTAVESAIAASLPAGEGQRHRCLFRLAQRLRGVLPLDADPALLREIVRAWHRLALPTITTKAWDESWSDFCHAWPRVRHPGGLAMREVLAAATAAGTHPACTALEYESPDRSLLVSLCAELQRCSGSHPFFLSCRLAGQLLGVDHHRAARLLSGLVADRVLIVANKGDSRWATRYRFLWTEGGRS